MSDIKKMTEAFENLDTEAKESMGKFYKLVQKCAQDPAEVEALIANRTQADVIHPDLANVEGMTSKDFAEVFGKMAEEVQNNAEKYAAHAQAAGMEPDELALLFKEIEGTIVRYPEVWESKEAAELLHPKNLSVLVHALKGDKE